MEHNFDLHIQDHSEKNAWHWIKRKSMRRGFALFLSIVLAAGTCMPTLAAEQPVQETTDESLQANPEQAAEEETETLQNDTEDVSTETGSDEGAAEKTDTEDKETSEEITDTTGEETAVETEEETTGELNEETAGETTADETETADEASDSDSAQVAGEESVQSADAKLSGADAAGSSGASSEPEVPDWLKDYEYHINEYDNTIILYQYQGSETELTVYGTAVIGDKEYQVYADEVCPWGNQVTSLTFTDGFQFRKIQSGSYYFSSMSSLEMIDLGNADFSEFTIPVGVKELMFRDCLNLQTLIVPGDIGYPIRLSGAFADDKGNVFKGPAQEPDHVTTYTRVEIDGWLKDYSFTASGNRVVLLGYGGEEEEHLTVHGSAEIIGNQYDEIEFTNFIGTGYYYNLSQSLTEVTFEKGVILSEDSSNLLKGCKKLTTVDMSEADVSEVVNMDDMFAGCESLATIMTPKNLTCDAVLSLRISLKASRSPKQQLTKVIGSNTLTIRSRIILLSLRAACMELN